MLVGPRRLLATARRSSPDVTRRVLVLLADLPVIPRALPKPACTEIMGFDTADKTGGMANEPGKPKWVRRGERRAEGRITRNGPTGKS